MQHLRADSCASACRTSDTIAGSDEGISAVIYVESVPCAPSNSRFCPALFASYSARGTSSSEIPVADGELIGLEQRLALHGSPKIIAAYINLIAEKKEKMNKKS